MTIRIGINGFGRIGRTYLRAALAGGADHQGLLRAGPGQDPLGRGRGRRRHRVDRVLR